MHKYVHVHTSIREKKSVCLCTLFSLAADDFTGLSVIELPANITRTILADFC